MGKTKTIVKHYWLFTHSQACTRHLSQRILLYCYNLFVLYKKKEIFCLFNLVITLIIMTQETAFWNNFQMMKLVLNKLPFFFHFGAYTAPVVYMPLIIGAPTSKSLEQWTTATQQWVILGTKEGKWKKPYKSLCIRVLLFCTVKQYEANYLIYCKDTRNTEKIHLFDKTAQYNFLYFSLSSI